MLVLSLTHDHCENNTTDDENDDEGWEQTKYEVNGIIGFLTSLVWAGNCRETCITLAGHFQHFLPSLREVTDWYKLSWWTPQWTPISFLLATKEICDELS